LKETIVKKTLTIIATAILVIPGAALFAYQNSPVDIAKGDLPKKAPCVVCAAGGTDHGDEKPAAGVRFKGKEYYFCNAGEVTKFKADPESFMPPVLPRPAPALELKTLNGETASLADYKGKVVLLDFWGTWCGPCVKTVPELQKLHTKYSGKGFTVLGAAVGDTSSKVRDFIKKRKVTYPMLLDDSGWKKWGVQAVPAMFLVDKNGQIVRQWRGVPDKKEVDSAVVALL
jgi:peroxiredoxin/YHS domain-containing protein